MLIKNTPDYAKDFKNEYLFIIGINNEFKYFLDNMNEATRGLFENLRVDKIKKFISKFLLYQNSGYFKDLSNFEIKSSGIKNLIRIKKKFNDFNNLINYRKDCYDGDEQNFVDPCPGFINIIETRIGNNKILFISMITIFFIFNKAIKIIKIFLILIKFLISLLLISKLLTSLNWPKF